MLEHTYHLGQSLLTTKHRCPVCGWQGRARRESRIDTVLDRLDTDAFCQHCGSLVGSHWGYLVKKENN